MRIVFNGQAAGPDRPASERFRVSRTLSLPAGGRHTLVLSAGLLALQAMGGWRRSSLCTWLLYRPPGPRQRLLE